MNNSQFSCDVIISRNAWNRCWPRSRFSPFVWAGNMSQMTHCDWLPEWARWSYLARSGLPVPREKFPLSQMINPLLTKVFRSRWLELASFFICEFMDLDFVAVHKQAKKNNIQPSWPHACSKTHIPRPITSCGEKVKMQKCWLFSPKNISRIAKNALWERKK